VKLFKVSRHRQSICARQTETSAFLCRERHRERSHALEEDAEAKAKSSKTLSSFLPVTCTMQSMQGAPMPGRCIATQHFACDALLAAADAHGGHLSLAKELGHLLVR
jgi:hypothetical protein